MNAAAQADLVSVREARRRFFLTNCFGEDGGYGKRFYWLGARFFRVPVPNTVGRVRAVRLHDLHHVATGYATTWAGEGEIAAWELAGGCGRHLAAWMLNFYALSVGCLLAPRALWNAFLSGRRSRNLYAHGFREELLDEPLGSLRARLEIPSGRVRAEPLDALAFAGTLALAGAATLLTGVMALLPLCAVMIAVVAHGR